MGAATFALTRRVARASDNASSLARVKTLVDSAKLSTDAAEPLLGSVAKKSVLEGLSKVGTVASIVGGVIEGIQGSREE